MLGVPLWGPHVSVGSNSEVELADADFRFTPESRHPAGGLGCPFRAMCGRLDAGQTCAYEPREKAIQSRGRAANLKTKRSPEGGLKSSN
jgi:hypothetical protein